jgi:23S rRNA pseudouridine1911/1915/1917 synthase
MSLQRIADEDELESALHCAEIAEVAEFTTSPEDAGLRLDHYLVTKLEGRTRTQIQEWIEHGRVLMNGRPTKASVKLKPGAEILVEIPKVRAALPEPEAGIPLDILFEDRDLLVLNKQVGLVVHPAPSCPSGTLVNALLHHCQDLSGIRGVEKPGIVHRLDKDTTGLMVVAKNDAAHLGLSQQFENRQVTKVYEALAHGFVSPAKGRINQPIKRHGIDRIRMSVNPQGKQAVTDYQVLEYYEYQPTPGSPIQQFSRVELHLLTGRTHQIRVHLAHLGYPLVGDPVYGKRPNPFGVEGQLLHCKRLGFHHPVSHQALEFEAVCHPEFQNALDFLKAYVTPMAQDLEQRSLNAGPPSLVNVSPTPVGRA